MFERYSEEARRTLFFARYAVAEHGGTQLEPEHLLLGVLRADPEAVLRFVSPDVALDVIRARLVANVADDTKLPKTHEIRFSERLRIALERAEVEADDLADANIRPEHLILGLLVKTSGEANVVLRDAGVQMSAMRKFLSRQEER
jgi:ATP-dependent Clp protease ATP-binding subunit ClpC